MSMLETKWSRSAPAIRVVSARAHSRTLRAAADLLAAADSIDTLAPIAAAIGCDGEPSPLDADTRRALGLDDDVVDARVAAGTRRVARAASRRVRRTTPARVAAARLGARLAQRTPHVLWVVIATQPATRRRRDRRMDWRSSAAARRRARRATARDSSTATPRRLRALGAVDAERDVLAHARWVEILGREALTIRFYRALERVVTAHRRLVGRRHTRAPAEIALLNTSRLLFLSFLEAKGWLDGDRAFLAHQFDRCMTAGGRFHDRVLRPLFFGTLNTPLPATRAGGEGIWSHSVPQWRPVRANTGRAATSRARVLRRRVRDAHLRAVRPVSLHCARRDDDVDRSGGRSRDARPRVRVAHGVARATTDRRVLHAVRARRASRDAPDSRRRSATMPRICSTDARRVEAVLDFDRDSPSSPCSIRRAARARFSCTRSSASPPFNASSATDATSAPFAATCSRGRSSAWTSTRPPCGSASFDSGCPS